MRRRQVRVELVPIREPLNGREEWHGIGRPRVCP